MMISKSQPVVHDDKMGNIWATATKKATHFQSDFGGIIWNLNALLPNVNRSLKYAWLRDKLQERLNKREYLNEVLSFIKPVMGLEPATC